MYNFPNVPRHAVVLIGLCALTFFAGLGQPALTDSDEAFYAESAREMVERDDWLTPYYNYATRFEKPVLYYWLAATTYAIIGPSPGAARVPAALAGIGLVLLTFACAKRWYDDDRFAQLAGTIVATSFGYVAMARQALPDLPLAFFVTLTTWAALVAVLDEPNAARRSSHRRRWLLTAAIGAAGAVLVKGPVGIALPAIVVVPVAALERWRTGARWRVGPVDLALAALAFVAVAAPWYAAMVAEHGVAYLDRFFIGENLDRFATARYNAPRSVLYYLPILVGGLLPWSPFMLLWVPSLRDAWQRHRVGTAELRLAVWALAPLLFYTVSIGKQPRYILPILPPLAILLAGAVKRGLDNRRTPARLFTMCAAATGMLVIAIGTLVLRARPLLIEWPPAWTFTVAAAIAVSGLVVLGVALASAGGGARSAGGRAALPALIAAASTVTAIGAHCVVLASPERAPVEKMAAMVAAAREGDEPYGRYRVFDRNLVFYTRTPHVELPVIEAARDFLRSPERVLCVLRADDAARLELEGLTLHRLGEISYLNTGNLNLRTLLEPDPSRDVHRIVLVANR